MSLFGDENDSFGPSPRHNTGGNKDLFGADSGSGQPSTPSRKGQGASLFGDVSHADDGGGGDSSGLWQPTPNRKRAERATLVKTLLSEDDVPREYLDVWRLLSSSSSSSSGESGTVSQEQLKEVLHEAGVEGDEAETILRTVCVAGANALGEGEVFVFLALVGLAQEGDEITLDGVDERRRRLPLPNVGRFAHAEEEEEEETPAVEAESVTAAGQPVPASKRQSSYSENDPWASPDMHRGHNHGGSNGNTLTIRSNMPDVAPGRTTSAYSASTTGGLSSSDAPPTSPPARATTASTTGGWGGYSGGTGGVGGFGDAGLGASAGGVGGIGGEDGFGQPPVGGDGPGEGGSSNDPTGLGAPLPKLLGSGPDEVITVTALPEKEGMFMFQHRNYHVTSSRRNSKVTRRYSDFTWLLDCLHKRYPYRQLPLLPPKRVSINGNYLAADASFVEKRRRGLARFANSLVCHPVLKEDHLVVMFLTVPTELAVWRKQASITITDEFTNKPLPESLEDSLPADLPVLFDRVRTGVRRAAEQHILLCQGMDRMLKRNDGLAAEYTRIAAALRNIVSVTNDAYATEAEGPADVSGINNGMDAAARSYENAKALCIDEARAWDEGPLEDLKRMRDLLVSVRDMFERRERYERDGIPALERRIQSNEQRLKAVRAKPEGTAKPGEAEKIEEAIIKDKQAIVDQHARAVLIKECLRDEIRYFQSSQFATSRLHQDWAAERVKYAELFADNWRALADEVESMPLRD